MDSKQVDQICERYKALYTGIVGDVLDSLGRREQVLPYYLTAFTRADRLAGLAFTGLGEPAGVESDDSLLRLEMLDSITPGTVSIWSCGGHMESAHWGEIMSTAARARGCTGAVIDGGVRDVPFIDILGFPVFARFKSPGSSIGRWSIKAWQIPITIGKTAIVPGDLIFGDSDGVVVVPQAMIEDVLAEAETRVHNETGMRGELSRGLSMKDAFAKYGVF